MVKNFVLRWGPSLPGHEGPANASFWILLRTPRSSTLAVDSGDIALTSQFGAPAASRFGGGCFPSATPESFGEAGGAMYSPGCERHGARATHFRPVRYDRRSAKRTTQHAHRRVHATVRRRQGLTFQGGGSPSAWNSSRTRPGCSAVGRGAAAPKSCRTLEAAFGHQDILFYAQSHRQPAFILGKLRPAWDWPLWSYEVFWAHTEASTEVLERGNSGLDTWNGASRGAGSHVSRPGKEKPAT